MGGPEKLSRRSADETLDAPDPAANAAPSPVPGVLLLVTASRATLHAFPWQGAALAFGRNTVHLDDPRMSRSHAELSLESEGFRVRDLGSRNGTFVNGKRLVREELAPWDATVRFGDSLIQVRQNVAPFTGASVEIDGGRIQGPTLAQVYHRIAQSAATSSTLYLLGETGSGKELAARHFHEAGPRPAGPFIPVNCGAIPSNLAERLLFGARRGAYSGADSDADGYLQAADGGTLFLDEIADLPGEVQTKLLRAVESGEVLQLGATRPRRVDVRWCMAGSRDLAEEVRARRFRDDLFYRLSRPSVRVPPLRERAEEIPWLVQRALTSMGGKHAAHISLHEAALLRPWRGNVRELLAAIKDAARTAGSRELVQAADLEESTPPPPPVQSSRPDAPTRADLELALREAGGNVSKAAQALGLHRTQMRRLMVRYGLDRR